MPLEERGAPTVTTQSLGEGLGPWARKLRLAAWKMRCSGRFARSSAPSESRGTPSPAEPLGVKTCISVNSHTATRHKILWFYGLNGRVRPEVMGVALNGKDDLRMLRGALMVGFTGVTFLFTAT